jgi:hypothetical protein
MFALVLASILTRTGVSGYREVKLAGWTLEVEPALISKYPHLWAAVRQEAGRQFEGIDRVVPDGPLSKLHAVTIWVHIKSPETKCMAYHPAAEWLSRHHMDARMAHGVEIGNAANFVSWTYEQPWMLLHELAHSYHYLVLPQAENNPDVKAAYDAAMATHRYDDVRHWNGKMVKAYAATNPMEYFAECTEAYFGTNDFFPFVRGELEPADPDGYALMVKVWGKPVKRLPTD